MVFKLEKLAAVVDTSIKHDRVRRYFGVQATEGDDGEIRGTSAAWGGRSWFTGFSLRFDVLGLLADLGRVGGVGLSKGVLLAALPAGGLWVSFGHLRFGG